VKWRSSILNSCSGIRLPSPLIRNRAKGMHFRASVLELLMHSLPRSSTGLRRETLPSDATDHCVSRTLSHAAIFKSR
jgi:hypothetical protein